MILSIVAISPDKKLYGNSVQIDQERPYTALAKSIEQCTQPEWPRIFVTSEGPINVTT